MKTRLMMLLACASALFAGALWADTEMAYGLVWTYSIVNGKAEIRNSSSTAVSPKPKKDLVIPVKLGGKPVAVIGANALSGCSDLTSVTIPSTVTTIEAGAFSSCTKLRSVKIPDAVTGIGESAFKGCSALQCVELGKKVNSIGATAFMNCGSLVSFEGDNDLISEDRHSLIKDGILIATATAGLTNYQTPSSVTQIGAQAFYGSTLQTISILYGVTSTGWAAFAQCANLERINIPKSVTNISDWAFSGCTSLSEVILGADPSFVISGGALRTKDMQTKIAELAR